MRVRVLVGTRLWLCSCGCRHVYKSMCVPVALWPWLGQPSRRAEKGGKAARGPQAWLPAPSWGGPMNPEGGGLAVRSKDEGVC